jgi:hypothetical protein
MATALSSACSSSSASASLASHGRPMRKSQNLQTSDPIQSTNPLTEKVVSMISAPPTDNSPVHAVGEAEGPDAQKEKLAVEVAHGNVQRRAGHLRLKTQ